MMSSTLAFNKKWDLLSGSYSIELDRGQCLILCRRKPYIMTLLIRATHQTWNIIAVTQVNPR